METTRSILFVCPHGAAKSVIAAAYFRREATLRGMHVDAASGGTEPDAFVPPTVVEALRAEGIDVAGYRPRHVTREELAAADRVVSLGCDLDGLITPGMAIERWDDLPLVSEDVDVARAAIQHRVVTLLDEMGRP